MDINEKLDDILSNLKSLDFRLSMSQKYYITSVIVYFCRCFY